MDFSNFHVGYGITGSFCTFAETRKALIRLREMGARITPIFSYQAQSCDTRFGSAKEFVEGICTISESEGIRTIVQAEPIGPNNFLDIMVIAPCTGNTAAKLANGSNAEISDMFLYYSSIKNAIRAWAVAAIIQLPIYFIDIVADLMPLISKSYFLTQTLSLIRLAVLTVLFFVISLRLFPFINSVVSGNDQPISLCLKASYKATKGKSWRIFAFYISFLPWILLSLLTVGVLFIIFTFPYILITGCLYSKYLLTGEYRDHITEETL